MSQLVKAKDGKPIYVLQNVSDSDDVVVAVGGKKKTNVKPIGNVVNSCQNADRKLIHLVKSRPLLYSRNNLPIASYYSQVKKLWQQVANAMGWKVPEVRRKWSHIRNSYSRHLRNEMYGVCTGSGRVVSKWYLADELAFLRDHMATDTQFTKCISLRSYQRNTFASKYTPATLDLPTPSSAPLEEEDVKPIIQHWSTTMSPASPLAHHDNGTGDAESSPFNFGPEENSSYFQFFRGIYSEYQELPVLKQRLFQRQCLSLLHHLLDDYDSLVVPDVTQPMNLSNSPEVDASASLDEHGDTNES